jgi:hypothetical protein
MSAAGATVRVFDFGAVLEADAQLNKVGWKPYGKRMKDEGK